MGDAADTEPGRVHAEAGDGLDDLVGTLTVGEGKEHRGHGADVLDVGTQVQQVAVDAEELGHHHADEVDPRGHLDAGELLYRKDVGQVVHHPTEVVDPVGVGDVAVPGLALGHLLGATVVIADLGHAVDDLFAVQLQDDAEGTVGRGVVRAQVQEHEVGIFRMFLHAPLFGLESQGFLFEILFGGVQRIGIELGGPRGIVLAQRVPLPVVGHQHALGQRVAIEVDAVHVEHFPLVPVGIGEDAGRGRQAEVVRRKRHLEHHIAVTVDGQQVVENGEVRVGQAAAVSPQALVHAMQVIEHDVGAGQVAQEAQHFDDFFARHPDHRHAGTGVLQGQGVCAELALEFANHRRIAGRGERRGGQSGVCGHDVPSLSIVVSMQVPEGTYTSSGLRRLVTWMRRSRFCSRCEGISAR